MSATPPWLAAAQAKRGVREIAGRLHSAAILGWLKTLGAWWRDDETAWCGAFIAICVREAGLAYPKEWYRAREWAGWGLRLRPERLAPGAVLVFERPGGGHVGFYVGESATAYRVLGGNQGNRVCEAWIAKDRLLASRWPAGQPVLGGPVHLDPDATPLSRNEA